MATIGGESPFDESPLSGVLWDKGVMCVRHADRQLLVRRRHSAHTHPRHRSTRTGPEAGWHILGASALIADVCSAKAQATKIYNRAFSPHLPREFCKSKLTVQLLFEGLIGFCPAGSPQYTNDPIVAIILSEAGPQRSIHSTRHRHFEESRS